MSEAMTIGSIAAALAKAQGSMGSAKKDKVNPHLKSKYADLASIWDACREPLAANGLAIVQLVQVATDDRVAVETRLLHASGESLSSVCVVPVAQKTAQGIGSAITYARRYGLSAMVGVTADDDDDGHAASQGQERALGRGLPTRRQEAPPPPPPSGTPPAESDPIAKEVAALMDALAAAKDSAPVALVSRIAALPKKEKDALRAVWAKRDAEGWK